MDRTNIMKALEACADKYNCNDIHITTVAKVALREIGVL